MHGIKNGNKYLTAKETPLLALLARTPELEIIFSWIAQIQDTFLMRKGRHINVDRKPVRGSSIETEQNKLPARIRRDGHDRLDPNRLRAELVLPPAQTLIGTEEDMICRIFVIGHDENGTGISEFVEVGILVDFLPGKPGVATQEGVTVRVIRELFSDVSDSHDHTGNRWGTERSPSIETFGIPVKVKRASLNRGSLRCKQVDYRHLIPLCCMRTCGLENRPWEVRLASRSHLPQKSEYIAEGFYRPTNHHYD